MIALGCGPATQLAQVASLNPEITFTGLHLSEQMLASGRAYCTAQNIDNVNLRVGDITQLTGFADQSVDGIISTMTLHQLPEFNMLESTFSEISRVLKADGALYLVVFGRLTSPKSCKFVAHLNAEHQPQAFTEDYQASLHAAFLFSEYQQLTQQILPGHISIFGTFPIPMLTIIKSPDRPLPQALKNRLCDMRVNLPTKYRRELKDMCIFTSFGGLKNDPFRADKN